MRLRAKPAAAHMLLTAAIAFAYSCGTVAASTVAPELTQSVSAAKKKPKHVRQRAPQQPEHIACTINGCHPTPPGCHPRIGYYSNGIPSGFDVVACPPGR